MPRKISTPTDTYASETQPNALRTITGKYDAQIAQKAEARKEKPPTIDWTPLIRAAVRAAHMDINKPGELRPGGALDELNDARKYTANQAPQYITDAMTLEFTSEVADTVQKRSAARRG